jgi:hypothetical protein
VKTLLHWLFSNVLAHVFIINIRKVFQVKGEQK